MSKKGLSYLLFFVVLLGGFYAAMITFTDFEKVKLPVLNTVQPQTQACVGPIERKSDACIGGSVGLFFNSRSRRRTTDCSAWRVERLAVGRAPV